MYLPLCGEELEVGSYRTPPRGVPIPETSKGRTGRTWVCVPLCNGALGLRCHLGPQRGVPIPQTAEACPGGSGVSATV